MSLLHKGNMTDRSVFMLLFSVTQPGCERENALSRFSKKHPVCFCLSIVFCGFFVVVCLCACFLFPGCFCHTISCWCKWKSDGLEVLTWEFFRSYSTPPTPDIMAALLRWFVIEVRLIVFLVALNMFAFFSSQFLNFHFVLHLSPYLLQFSTIWLTTGRGNWSGSVRFATFFSPCLGDLLQFLPLREVICVEEQQLLRPSQWCGNLA